jgi:hypothetical protein
MRVDLELRWKRWSAVPLAVLIAGVATACGSPLLPGLPGADRRCADLVAHALTSRNTVVEGAFSCMTADERNFWHRWAISRDDQLPDVVRNHGLTSAGMVDGYSPMDSWSSARFEGDLEANQHLYLVRADDGRAARALLLVATDTVGRVDSFALTAYDIGR